MIRSIVLFDNPLLREKSQRVDDVASIQKLANDMIDTLRNNPWGSGLAAPQVGVLLRVIIAEGEYGVFTLINPEVVKRYGERIVEEGCLSIPGRRVMVKRSVRVVVEGLNRRGKKIKKKAGGLLAQTLEHEIDHLNGILITDLKI